MKDVKYLQQRVFAEQVTLLFKQYPLAALAGFLVALFVTWVLWPHVPRELIVGWLATQSVFLLTGTLVVLRFHFDQNRQQRANTWFYRYMAAIAAIALLWGSLSLFLLLDLPTHQENFLFLIAVGAAASSLVLAIPVQTAYYTYLTLPLAPAIFWLLSQPEAMFRIIGGVGVLFYLLLVFAGRSLNQQLVNSISLRYQKDDLANEVRQLNENLEQRVREKSQALFESEERFNLAMLGASDGLWDWDLDKRSVYFSPRWKSMLGYTDDEIGHSTAEWRRRVHPEDLRRVMTLIRIHLNGETDAYESIHRMQHKDGHYLWILDRGRAVLDKHGAPYRMVGTQVDITEHKILEEQLKSANLKLKQEAKDRQIAQNELAHLAKHDPLTNLPNRLLFYEQLRDAIRRSELEGNALAVLLVDLDNFKHVNDTLGHPVGDKLLVSAAKRLNTIANKYFFLSRFGGDEFLVVLENCSDIFLIDAYAREIVDLISQPFHIDDQEVRIGCSIGITVFPEHGKEADQLVRNADIAMYHAKDRGRNTYAYFTEEMNLEVNEKVTLRNMLHGALDRREFEIHYQPQISIDSGLITGFEALLRWRQDMGGPIQPERFIPLLEEAGLISEVGHWVLHEACKQAVSLQKRGLTDFKMAVNISPRQLMQEDLVRHIQAILTETGLEAKHLDIEITENIFMEDLEQVQQTLQRLKTLGISITLDDFGTGYSSLGYLKRFPIDGVKIDKVFIRDLFRNDDSRELVNAIIAMARGLNMQALVAEGVESKHQLELLRRAGCPTYQGYLYSQPLPRHSLEKLLFPGSRLSSL